ncbi:MAG: rRNA maturation RNase YbeY [Candidatus Eisenbacteria bacterium]|nr:rRNA maturation RNase YbeY [Candidatus Eisenbacteria bacterium]
MATIPKRPVPIQLRYRGIALDREALQRLVSQGLDQEGAHADLGIGLILAGDRLVHRLNRDFRGKDRPTDVLSFTNDEPDLDPDEPRLLGEVIISLPQCVRQAREQAVPTGVELVRLVVHGVLHVLGYDHIAPEDRKRMAPRERKLRAWATRQAIGASVLRASAARAPR